MLAKNYDPVSSLTDLSKCPVLVDPAVLWNALLSQDLRVPHLELCLLLKVDCALLGWRRYKKQAVHWATLSFLSDAQIILNLGDSNDALE